MRAGELEFTLGRARGRVTLPGRTFETSRRIPEEVFTTGEERSVSDLLDGNMSSVHMGTIALGIRHVLCLPLRLVRYAQERAIAPARNASACCTSTAATAARSCPTRRAPALETLATEAATAIENARLYREEVEKLRLEQEMNIAAQIQKALLPEPRYHARGFEAAAVSVPCRAIGGDFYDYVELSDGLGFGFALGDVAGKGPSAALLTAAIQACSSCQARRRATVRRGRSRASTRRSSGARSRRVSSR